MTLTQEGADAPPVPEGYVRLTIDDRVVDAPKGELIIRTCERLGIIVPRFCDHPLLDPAGACRQCLVEVEMGGRPMPKPQASCTMTVADGMVVRTQHTSKVADKAQQGVMELLLINHPLDCPICDKGGECPLQNQAMSSGRTESRFVDTKRTFAKPIPISTEVLLDRERCVLCQRCTRFSEQIAGDPFIELLERGAQQQVGVAEDKPFQSYFSGNTIQICPVGALTSAAYRFRSRPFDLVSTPTVCEHCACGSAMRTDTRRGVVLRRMAGNDPAVNEEWIDDKSRFAFRYLTSPDRITRPMVRQPDGTLAETSWTEALSVAARGLLAAREGGIGVLAGGRLTVEDAYAYGKFARVAAGTNDVDFRARPHSAEELAFLAAHVVGQGPEVLDYTRLEAASTVLCVALEPEEEAPIVYLRLRSAVRKHGQNVYHLGQWTTPAVERTSPSTGAAAPPAKDNLIPVVPGAEAAVLGDLPEAVLIGLARGGVVLVGERAAEVPGLYSAVSALAARTGAVVGWVPRRAGERGALDAGAAPTLLPGGRAVADAADRAAVEDGLGPHHGRAAHGAGPRHRRHPRRGGDGRAGRARGRRARPVRPGRSGGRARGPARGRVPGEPGDAPLAGHRPRRCGAPGGAGRPARGHVPQLGGAGPVLRGRPRRERCAARLPRARHVGRRDGRGPVHADPRRRGGRVRPARPAHRGRARGAEDALAPSAHARLRAGRAGHLAPAHRRFDARMQRAAPRGHGPARGRAGQRGHRRAAGAHRGPARHGAHRAGRHHVAGGAGRPARRRGVAAGQLRRIPGPRRARRRPRRPGGGDGMIAADVLFSAEAPSALLLAQAQPDGGMTPTQQLLADDPLWLVVLKVVALFAVGVVLTLFMINWERKVVGRMQQRPGPNRVGPGGWLQSLADGLKLAFKEDIMPVMADKRVYFIAPIISCIPAFVAFSVIPFGGEVTIFGEQTVLQLVDLPVGVLVVLACSSVGVYGIVLAGWSSGSPYPLLAALRSAAQVISYEIALGLSVVGVVLYAGSLSTADIVASQQQSLWNVILLLPSFVVFVIAMTGETNRAPFDLPEAESELVGGFHTEYTSLKFALFFLAEYVNMVTVSAMATTLFLGGGTLPFLNLNGWLEFVVFIVKTFIFLFVFIWLRGTLPRMRYDQFMRLGWKVLVPISLLWILLIFAVRTWRQSGGSTGALLVAVGIGVAVVLIIAFLVPDRRQPEEPVVELASDYPVPPLDLVVPTKSSRPKGRSRRERRTPALSAKESE